MSERIRILSTKQLTPPQRERLLNAGFALVETPFVKTEEVPFTPPKTIERAIITSSNAVRALAGKGIQIGHCYCVGHKTAAALEAAGYHPELIADTGETLARQLVSRYPGEHFYYLGTRARREELPLIFKEHLTPLTEIEVYKTLIETIEVPGNFDGILFFSPSAVNAFSKNNPFSGATCFSIGPTTEKAIKPYSQKVITARKPSAEHLILETIKYFKVHN